MPVGWRRVVRAVRERGQSEVLGATLLTGIMVILVAMAGLFLFADFGGDEEQLLANIEGDVAAEGITLTHDGGDSFDSADIAVVLTGDNDRDLNLSRDFNASQGGDGQLAPGDVWRYNSSDDLILGSGRMLVIDESTNTVLFDEGYRVEVVPGGIELRVESFNHLDTQSDEADIFGEGDPDDDGVRWNYEAFVDFDDDGDPVKNPDEINISFDSSAPLEHNLTDHDLVAYNPSSNPESVTVTASVDGFTQSDDVNVDVYQVAELSVSIETKVPPSPSPSPFSARSSSALGTQSSDNQIPLGSLVEVTFTFENNDPAPTLAQEVELSSGAFNETKSSEIDSLDPGDSRKKTLQFNTTATPGSNNPKLEVETSSGTKTFALGFIDTSFDATDLVPNAEQQQTFTLDDVQSGKEVTIKPTNAEDAYDSVSVHTDDGSASVSDGDITYEATSLSQGETAKIRVEGVEPGDLNSGPYEYELTGPGIDKSTQSKIARGSGDSGFASVSATGFDSNSDPTLSFKLSSDDIQVGSAKEKVAIDLGDAVSLLDMGDAQVNSVSDNVENSDDKLSDGSYVVVELKSSYSAGDTVTVTLGKIDPRFEGEAEIGFSRGANDTASDTIEIEPGTQQPSPFESVEVTDIVPNGQGQQQLISFTANSSLDKSQLPNAGETIDIVINAYEPVSGGDGQVAYGGSVATLDSQGQIEDENTNDNGQLTLKYKPASDLSPGETIKMRATDINVARLDEQADPYEVRVGPSDSLVAENTTFNVTRSGTAGDAGLSTFTVEDLTGTNTQTLNITFEPDEAFTTGENENGAVTVDLTDALIDSDVYWDGNSISIVEGKGSLDSDNTSEAAYITYTAPNDGYDETVTIQLTVNPDQTALGESYTVGVSRGTAGTAGATFGVFQPAQFDVTVKEEESFLGTFYGSESSGLSVAAEVENTANYPDTQTITLDVGGTQNTTSVNLAGGESKTVTLSLDNLDNGSYTANVSSETDNATTDARVLGTTPDLLAGVETVSGTVGETVQVGVEVVSFDSGSNDVASYFLGFSYDNSKISLDTVKSDDWAKSNSDIGSGEVLVTGFTVGNPETTPAEPAISLGVTLDDSGETTIEFDDGTLPGSTTNRIEEDIGEPYKVYFVDGNVTVNPSS